MANWGTPGHLTLTYKIWSNHSNDCTSTNFVPHIAKSSQWRLSSAPSVPPLSPEAPAIHHYGGEDIDQHHRGQAKASSNLEPIATSTIFRPQLIQLRKRPQERPRCLGTMEKKISHHGCNFLPTDIEPKLTSNHFFHLNHRGLVKFRVPSAERSRKLQPHGKDINK